VKRLVFFLSFLFIVSCASTPEGDPEVIDTKPLTEQQKRDEKVDLYISIAENLEKRSKVTLATENYKSAIELDPNKYEAHFKLGRLLLKRGFFKEGLASIQKSIEIKKDYTEAYIFLAYYFYNQDRKKLANKFISKAAEDIVYPDQEKIWALKLKLARDLKQNREVGDIAIKAFSTIPMSCTNRTSIAFSLAGMGIKRPALRAVNQASTLCGTREQQSKLSYIKGYIYYKQGEYAVAKELLLKVVSQDNALNQMVPRLLMSIDKKMELSY
jgi:tetratricopeptide (TPR) repeat protein